MKYGETHTQDTCRLRLPPQTASQSPQRVTSQPKASQGLVLHTAVVAPSLTPAVEQTESTVLVPVAVLHVASLVFWPPPQDFEQVDQAEYV
jgi:hypothetical protein